MPAAASVAAARECPAQRVPVKGRLSGCHGHRSVCGHGGQDPHGAARRCLDADWRRVKPALTKERVRLTLTS